jgi:hypothetical protein
MNTSKEKNTVKNQTSVRECPVCHATAVDACKQPEKKETRECPRSQ